MANEPLDAFGDRFNKGAKRQVFFDPTDDELEPGLIKLDMLAVDDMLGGGLPCGRTSMIIGEPSSGKTLLAQLFIAATQRQGGTAVYVDAEHTYSRRWFEATGVETKRGKLIIARPLYLEEAFDAVVGLMEKARPTIIVIDSLPALIPKVQVEAEMMKQDFRGIFPRKVTEGIGKATAANHGTALVVINQLRTSMGVTFGSPESLPGGKALKHYVSMIVRVRRGRWLTSMGGDFEHDSEDFTTLSQQKDAQRVGFMLRLRTDKNKLASPWQEAEFKFYFIGEVDPTGALVTLGIERRVIDAEHGFYTLPGVEKKVHGRDAVERLLRENDELREKLTALIEAAPS